MSINYLSLNKESTILNQLNPLTRFLCMALTVSILLCFNDPFYVVILVISLLVFSAVVLSPKKLYRARKMLLFSLIIPMISWPFFLRTSTLLWSWGRLMIYKEALLYGIAMGFRLLGLIVTGLFFISTMKPEEFHYALVSMKVPYPLAFVFSLAMRLVPMYLDEATSIVQAQISRGLDLSSGNLIQRSRKYMALAVPLIMSVTRNADLMAVALESKGFTPEGKRSSYLQRSMQRADWLIVIPFGLMLAISVYMRYLGIGVILSGHL